MREEVYQATPEELKQQHRRCWRPNCKHKAFLIDWGGWHWCLKDWYRSTKDHVERRGLKIWWWYVKNTKIY